MKESEFTTTVIELATLLRWHVAHFRPAQMRSGKWATAMQGHVGYPDLTLARNGYLIFAELKSATGRPTVAQTKWLDQIGQSSTHMSCIWRPQDMATIRRTLRDWGKS